MRIAIVGSGAMGCVFGGHLTEAGHDVVLIDIWAEHVQALNKKGLFLTGVSGERTIRVHAVTEPRGLVKQDLVIVFVKSIDTEDAIQKANSIIGSDTIVLTLQNGLGNAERIGELVGYERVAAGVTAHGATILGPGRIRHAGSGETNIGPLAASKFPQIRSIAATLTGAGINTKAVKNVDSYIWSKLLVNAGINALTAILKMTNGDLVRNPEARQLLAMAVHEGITVACAKGIKLIPDDPIAYSIKTAMLTGSNISSMYQDVQAKRRTEIDVINGGIVTEGQKHGISTPINMVLTKLIKAIEINQGSVLS
ncbi:MAG: ketopantoate reductase family protein [Bacteroidales bacterium]|nr:ketopantoate reductase family protein [Bacteroidales bacterium]